MKVSVSALVVSLAALASASVEPRGLLDNLSLSVSLKSTAEYFSTGEYTIQSVATGSYLAFHRPEGGSVSLILQDDEASVFLETHTSGGDSGTPANTKGVIISDGLTKCGSAAWNFDPTDARDGYIVPYSCRFGSYQSDTASTLDDSKQLQLFYPVGTTSSSDDDVAAVDVVLAVRPQSSAAAPDTTSAEPSSTDAYSGTCPQPNWWVCRHQEYVNDHTDCAPALDTCVDYTVVATCAHPDWWVCRHQEYVDDHPECADALTTCSAARFVKRSHRELIQERAYEKEQTKAVRTKKAKRAGTIYNIIPTNHLTDMRVSFLRILTYLSFYVKSLIVALYIHRSTLAMSSKIILAFSDIKGAVLDFHDSSDESQQWIVTKV